VVSFRVVPFSSAQRPRSRAAHWYIFAPPLTPFITAPNDHRSPLFSAAGRTLPSAQASYLKWEDSAEPVYKTGYAAEYFIIDGVGTQDRIPLDGATLRNVIFRNIVIIYNGGPLRMQNVKFENCTFQVIHSDQGICSQTAYSKTIPLH
jgi:hypothetical protein